DAVHLVVEALALRLQLPLDPERGELVGHHAQRPARLVGHRVRMTDAQDLRRRLRLVAGAEDAVARARTDGLGREVRRATAALGRDDDPAPDHRVLPQLRHVALPPSRPPAWPRAPATRRAR